jgi:hypothetical protein
MRGENHSPANSRFSIQDGSDVIRLGAIAGIVASVHLIGFALDLTPHVVQKRRSFSPS